MQTTSGWKLWTITYPTVKERSASLGWMKVIQVDIANGELPYNFSFIIWGENEDKYVCLQSLYVEPYIKHMNTTVS